MHPDATACYTLPSIRLCVIPMVLMRLSFPMPTMTDPSIECLTRLPLPNELERIYLIEVFK